MKAQAVRRGFKWALRAALLAGLVYAGLAVSTKPVYASSCDCLEAGQDAVEICRLHSWSVASFQCPVGATQSDFTVTCRDSSGHLQGPFTYSCVF